MCWGLPMELAAQSAALWGGFVLGGGRLDRLMLGLLVWMMVLTCVRIFLESILAFLNEFLMVEVASALC